MAGNTPSEDEQLSENPESITPTDEDSKSFSHRDDNITGSMEILPDDAVLTPKPPLQELGDQGNQLAQVFMCVFIIVIVGLLAGYNTLHVPFHGEDQQLFVNSDAIHRLVTVPEAVALMPYAPLTLFGYAINWWISPNSAYFMHWLTVLLHIANAVLLYLVARKFAPKFINEPVAMLAGLAFVVHPAHIETMSYLVGRPVIQGTFFGLLALWLFLRLHQFHNSTPEKTYLYFSGILLCYILAVASYFYLFFLPVLFLGCYVSLQQSIEIPRLIRKQHQNLLVWLNVIGFGVFLLLLTRGALFNIAPSNVLTALSELSIRGARILFPIADPAPVFPSLYGLTPNMAGTVLFALLTILVFLALYKKFLVALPLLWIWLSLIALVVVMNEELVLAQRFLYLFVAGSMLVIPWLVRTMAKAGGSKAGGATAGIVLLLIVYSLYATYVYTFQWRFPETFWANAAEKYPDAHQPWQYLGQYYDVHLNEAQNTQEAGEWLTRKVNVWQNVLEILPEDPNANEQLGAALHAQGRGEQALPFLEKALRLNPNNGETALRLAYIYEQQMQSRDNIEPLLQALDYFRYAEKVEFMPPDGALLFGTILTYIGDFNKSLALMERVRLLESESETPLATRIQQMRTMLSQRDAMQQQVNQLMREQPGSSEALLMRAEYQLFTGDRIRTFYLLEGLLRREPENLNAWILMGVVRAALDEGAGFIEEWGEKHLERNAWRELAVRTLAGGQMETAKLYTRYFAEQTGSTELPGIMLADFAIELEQAMTASIVLRQVIEENPDEYAPWLRLARIARDQENTAAFQENLSEARRRGAPDTAINAYFPADTTVDEQEVGVEDSIIEDAPLVPRVITR